MEHCEICILQHCSPLQPLFILLPVPAFYAVPCSHLFLGFFFQFTPIIAFRFWFFCNFPYTEHLYKPQSVQTLNRSLHFTSAIQRVGGSFAAASSFLHFLSFSLPFSATKHSFEDNNSKDGWLDLFLLQEEVCWLGFEVN